MLDFNSIDISGWAEDPNVALTIAREIEKASWQKSPWEPFVGRGGDRGVRTYPVKNNAPYRPRLKTQLTGTGVKGNADFDTNFDNLEILSQTMYPRVIGNAIKSEIKAYDKLRMIDFVKESSDSLTDWITNKRDREFICALFNDLTNVVVAKKGGFQESAGSVLDTAKQVVKGDIINVATIRQAIFMARTGLKYDGSQAFPIKPIRSTQESAGGIEIQHYSYIILLDSYQIHQLKKDKEWVEMQKYAGDRGDKNRLFTGLVGMIDNCPVIDMGIWSDMQAGFLNSEVSDNDFKEGLNLENHSKIVPPSQYADAQPVSFGALIGASALVMAGADQVEFYIDDKQDVGRKTICGVDRLMAISKGRFSSPNGSSSPYEGQDFAVIGILSSME